MLARDVLLFLIVVNEAISARVGLRHLSKHRMEILCPALLHIRNGVVSCHHNGSRIPCHENVPVGTVAYFECDEYYVPKPTQIIECLINGTWAAPLSNCVPDCGKQTPFVALILNGRVATPGTFPWHVAIYNFMDGSYEFWCGGSLISQYLVITAAHCAWNIEEKNLMAAFGKFVREFEAVEGDVQKIGVIRVEKLTSYQDNDGNYNSDLAVLFLERPVKFSTKVRPICIDWNQDFVERQLTDGNLGTVLGWGLTEEDQFSDVLKFIQLPVKSDQTCISQLQKDFRKFVTYTSFCAGFRNGTGVCNGDSGGGLAFIDKQTDTWYLQGVVSVSPRRKGTSFCDPNFYTVFTKQFTNLENSMRKLSTIFGKDGCVNDMTRSKRGSIRM